MDHDPAYWGVAEVAAQIRGGMISSTEYVQELLGRCRQRQTLNAFTSLDPDAALEHARQCDHGRHFSQGPLHGVPLIVKDNIDVAGQATTGGTSALRDHVVRRNAEVWRRLHAAGAFVLGKANMHELALGVTGNNHTFGPALNPWMTDRTAGGSSGGTATAVAARLGPAGLGTDTGGSTRIPAAHCATVGYRPTRGRYGQHGVLLVSRTRDTIGFITRSVEDVALLDSVIVPSITRTDVNSDAEPAGEDATAGHPLTTLPWSEIRLGVPRRPFWQDLDPATATVCRRRLADLEGAGAVLIEVDLPAEVMEQVPEAAMTVALYETYRELSYYLAQTPPAPTLDELVDQVTDTDVRALLDEATRIPETAYQRACRSTVPLLSSTVTAFVHAHRVDALVYPTCPVPAQPVGHDKTVRLNGRQVPTFATYIRNTDIASILGWSALSLPAGLTNEGLPVGLELCGPPHTDQHLLRLSAGCQALWDWPAAPDVPPCPPRSP